MILRAWLAFAAIAAGIIHLSLVLTAPLGLALPMAVLGFVEFGWGVLTFAAEKPLVPRAAIAVALVPVLVWGFSFAFGGTIPGLGTTATLVPLGISSVLTLFVAAGLGWIMRNSDRPVSRPATPRYVLGVAIGAVVIAALMLPALAATQSGLPEGPVIDLPIHVH